MSYYNTRQTFFILSTTIKVEETEKIDKFLELLDKSGVCDLLKKQLLLSKKAEIKLEYSDGTKKTRIWNANKITINTNVLGNIKTSGYWRNRKKTGLILEITVL